LACVVLNYNDIDLVARACPLSGGWAACQPAIFLETGSEMTWTQ